MFTELALALPNALGCSRNTAPEGSPLPTRTDTPEPGSRLRFWPLGPQVAFSPARHPRAPGSHPHLMPPPCRTSVTSLGLRAHVCPHLHMAEWGVLTVLGV